MYQPAARRSIGLTLALSPSLSLSPLSLSLLTVTGNQETWQAWPGPRREGPDMAYAGGATARLISGDAGERLTVLIFYYGLPGLQG